MLKVVNDPAGTAFAAFHRGGILRLPGVTIGGKTGTAQFDKEVTLNGKRRKTRGVHA